MRKCFIRLLSAVLMLALLIEPLPVSAAEGGDWYPDLSKLIRSGSRRAYVEAMVGYHIQSDPAIRKTLRDGYSAVFFFEGASDNMDDPELSDISYYRVSAVCLVVRLDEEGAPYLSYYNMACSTLPDRPLEYGAWNIETVGEVGPATICDGTYELFSVKHGGAYEALHIRTDEEDDTIPAVYMTPEGYVLSRADMINIHTRNVNHTIQGAMWSAGCILIGDGSAGMFTELIESTYYAVYDTFSIGDRVGTVTVDRQLLKSELYHLYEDQDAVDLLLAFSRQSLPEHYFRQCGELEVYKEPLTLWAGKDTELMTLPCSHTTDMRSVVAEKISEKEPLKITGSIVNSEGNLWYRIEWKGRECYLYSGYAVELGWFDRMVGSLLGK